MGTLVVSTEGQNRLGLRELCQRYVDEQWLAAHMTENPLPNHMTMVCQITALVLARLTSDHW